MSNERSKSAQAVTKAAPTGTAPSAGTRLPAKVSPARPGKVAAAGKAAGASPVAPEGPARSATKARPAKLGAAKPAPAQASPAQAGSAKAGPAKVGPAKVGPAKVGPAKPGPAKAGPAKAAANEAVTKAPGKQAQANQMPATRDPAKEGTRREASSTPVPSKAPPVKKASAGHAAAEHAPAKHGAADQAPVVPAGTKLPPGQASPVLHTSTDERAGTNPAGHAGTEPGVVATPTASASGARTKEHAVTENSTTTAGERDGAIAHAGARAAAAPNGEKGDHAGGSASVLTEAGTATSHSPARGEPGPAGAPTAKPAPAAAATSRGYQDDPEFLVEQRRALLAERETYLEQATLLRAEAESLVAEMEPGDVQFDEESGEGGTVTVDRERDLALSAQALAAVEEIDQAIAKIDHGRYGVCEGCGQPIVKARLEALPYARLCVACKSGGLSRR